MQRGAYVGVVEEIDVNWRPLCARVRRGRRGSISSELLMCGGCVCSILLLPLVARCMETIDVWFLCLLGIGRCYR